MQYLISRIWLKTCLSRDEIAFDSYFSDFEEIVSNAITFINDEATNPQKRESHDSCGSFCGDTTPILHGAQMPRAHIAEKGD